MSRDDIIRMAREAGFDIARIAREAGYLCEEDWAKNGLQKFERFAALVAAHEREECVSKIFKLFAENRQFKAAVTVAQYFRGKK